MKGRLSITLLIIALILCCRTSTGRADDITRACPDGNPASTIEGATARVCVAYDKDRACTGMSGGKLRLRIISAAAAPLRPISLPEVDESDKSAIQFSNKRDGEAAQNSGVEIADYDYDFVVGGEAEPRPYNVKLQLRDETTDKLFSHSFQLRVCDDNGLVIDKTKGEVIEAETNETVTTDVFVRLTNPQYPVTVKKVLVSSTPNDLVERKVIDLPGDGIRVSKSKAATQISALGFKVRPMRAKDWIYGFNTAATVNFEFLYADDDKGENSKHEPLLFKANDSLKLTVKPSFLALSVAILLGVLAGAAVKTDLQRLQKEGYITRRQKVMFVVGTVALGLIAAVVAFLGNVKVSIFEISNAPSSPKLLFLVGFAATMSGPPLLRGVTKMLKGPSAEPADEDEK